ncbi:MAG: NAD(P)-binding domain-containing protein [Alphaproteobacteria bacterium]|nr:NAD(P)-binding domain-containing protein [Alphaproteobacteria bacterium]
MKIGIIGGGSVGQTLGAKLIANGHDVVLGIRTPSQAEFDKERSMADTISAWMKKTGGKVMSFAEAAKHGTLIINATSGGISLDALKQAGAENLKGKVLIDIANPLDFSRGMPPTVITKYTQGTSVGEELQSAFPETHVVKAFNTIAAAVMVDPSLIKGEHDLLISGNDTAAKKTVSDFARKEFGWTSIVDLGDIVGARGTEHYLPLWVRLWGATGTPFFNIKIVKS